MKTILSALLLTASFAASAQSFVLHTNGTLITVDSLGNSYDLNQFAAPTMVQAKGKSWMIDKNQAITTIDNKGFVYKKLGMKGPKALKASGGNWFISDKGEVNIVTNDGMLFTYNTDKLFKDGSVVTSGGNWMVINNKKALSFVTIDSIKGFTYTFDAATMAATGLDISKISTAGGNWLVDAKGALFTVDKSGLVGNKSNVGNFLNLRAKGSNWMVDSVGGIRVILDNGWVLLPTLPKSMGAITKSGTTHIWDKEGEFFTFAETANEAEVTSKNPKIFAAMLAKLVLQPSEQPDARTIAP